MSPSPVVPLIQFDNVDLDLLSNIAMLLSYYVIIIYVYLYV